LAALARSRHLAIKKAELDLYAGAVKTLLAGETPMKLVLTALGVLLLIVASLYFLLPADQLPGFLPGHEAGVARMHAKHGIVSALVGIALIAAGSWMRRK